MLRPNGFPAAAAWHVWQCGPQYFAGCWDRGNGRVVCEEILVFGTARFTVPCGVLQPAQPHEFQHAQSGGLRGGERRTVAHGGGDYRHLHDFAADSVGAEIIVVTKSGSQVDSKNMARLEGFEPPTLSSGG